MIPDAAFRQPLLPSTPISPAHALVLAALILVVSGSASTAEEFDWHRFKVAGRPAFMILPAVQKRRVSMPWVMYAPTFDRGLPNESHEGWMIRHFLDAGIAIAGVDVGESYGSPKGCSTYNALYKHLTGGSPKFAPKACLLARSRGGLMLYNWAAGSNFMLHLQEIVSPSVK